MTSESAVERHLIKRVHEVGGMTAKITPVVAGIPDRLVILPGGKIRLVELKKPTGRLRPAQRAWIAKAAKRGVEVIVLWSSAQVNAWIEEVMS